MHRSFVACATVCLAVGCGGSKSVADGSALDGGGRDGGSPVDGSRLDASPLPDAGPPDPDAGAGPPIVCVDQCRYVRAGASGDGSDWARALPELPDTLVRGGVYFVADGDYPGYTFDTPGEERIAVVKATSADHGTDVGWESGYGDGQAVFGAIWFEADAIDFDGRVGGGPGSWETGFGFRVRSGGHNIHLEGPREGIVLSHLDVENNGRYSTGHGFNEHSIYGIGGVRDLVVSHCYLHDVNGVHLLTGGSDGVVIQYSKLARNGPSGFDGGHRESWSATDDDNVTIRFNIFEDVSNTAFIALVNGVGDAEAWHIYGNVFWHSGATTDVAVSALVTARYADPHFITARGWTFHHNTVVGVKGLNAGLSLGRSEDVAVFNNLWFDNTVNAVGRDGEHDFNWYGDNIRTDGCPTPCDLDPDLVASERGAQHGTDDPFVDSGEGDFRLATPTEPGMTLPPPFDRDMTGALRGADGTWDRGALELVE